MLNHFNEQWCVKWNDLDEVLEHRFEFWMMIARVAYLSSKISKSLQPTLTKSTSIDLENMLTYKMTKYPLLDIKNSKMM